MFQLSLDITSGLDAVVLQFVDFQTDCTQRSRVWITEYGKQQAFHYCGRNKINNYLSKSGRVVLKRRERCDKVAGEVFGLWERIYWREKVVRV